ncbi:MAG: carboxymuconolactone decarboxylase family protein [Rhodospirillales bacterium]|nr:carboxymuconolactone decarboxylase family protein [Rhodospirillales bacterium]
MISFDMHSTDTAPQGSREAIASVEAKMGFLPNIYGILAESPSVIKAYTSITQLLNRGAFSPAEQQLMLLTTSAVNGCEYCVAAHTMVGRMAHLDDATIQAVRNGTPIADSKMAALHAFTKSVVENRGWVAPEEVDAFIGAGFVKAQVLEVILAISLKTISNYVNHFAGTPLDDTFEPDAWRRPDMRVA